MHASHTGEVLHACAFAAGGRTLLTFGNDFGELAFRRQLPAQFGIVLFRLYREPPTTLCEALL